MRPWVGGVLSLALVAASCGAEPNVGTNDPPPPPTTTGPSTSVPTPTTTIGEVASTVAPSRPAEPVSVEEALAENREKWQAAGITTYTLEVNFSSDEGDPTEFVCGKHGGVLVEVVDGRVETAVDRISGCQVDVEQPGPIPLTIEDLFEVVSAHSGAPFVEVQYEPDVGHPEVVLAEGAGTFVEVYVNNFSEGPADTKSADDVLETLRVQRATWTASGIDDYVITVAIGCFCPEEYRGPFEVTVLGGSIESVTRGGSEVIIPLEGNLRMDVPGLFATIERHAYADRIDVKYHPSGYPTRVDIDPQFNTIDEELGITVSGLVEQ